MFEVVVVATDGSASAERAVAVGLDLARRFDASVRALYVVDEDEIDAGESDRETLEALGADALAAAEEHAAAEIATAVREGTPVATIREYAREQDADLVVMGTRGRHGAHAFLLGSVAEGVVRTCPVPVLTVRQLESVSG